MTRLAILADIHGNLPALQAVTEDLKQYHPDQVIVAGDLINGVPFSREVIEHIYDRRWTAIRGNHEFYMLYHGTPYQRPGFEESPVPPYLNDTMADWRAYIAAMPDDLLLWYPDAPPIHLVHGIPGNNTEAVSLFTPDEQIREWLKDVEESVFVSGHYHIAVEKQVDDRLILNPGPVGFPSDGINKAGYLILDGNADGWVPTFHRVDYDVEAALRSFDEQNLIERLGIFAFLCREQIRYARPMINTYYKWWHTHRPPTANDAIESAEEFLKVSDYWDYLPGGYQVNRDLMP